MKYEKKKYEEMISASPLFSLDRSSAAFRRERYRMIENLYGYLMAVNAEAYESYGCEIMEISSRCIQNFDSEKGVFLHYFNSAWKQEYRRIRGDDAVDERLHGVRVTEAEKRTLKNYLRYEASLGKDLSQRETYEAIAGLMEKPLETIIEIAGLVDYRAVDNELTDSEGEGTSLFDYISDGYLVEDGLILRDKVAEILAAIEDVFLSLQLRQRPIISDMMTIRIAPVIAESGIDISGYSFVNEEILRQAVVNRLPSQRAIAEKYGKNEASISRTVKEFIKKLEINPR